MNEIRENCIDPMCTRTGFVGKDSICINMHCTYCGERCSPQGHFECPVREKEQETKIMTTEFEEVIITVDKKELDYLRKRDADLTELEKEKKNVDIFLIENSERTVELSE